MTYRILRWAGIPVAWINEEAVAEVTITTRRTVRVHHVEQVDVIHDFRQEVIHQIAGETEPARPLTGEPAPVRAIAGPPAIDPYRAIQSRAAWETRNEKQEARP